MKKSLLALAIASALTGCASFQQAVGVYGAAAVDSAKTTNDQMIYAWSTAACATPVSAALRNPQIIPALRVLCMSGADVVPASLLDPTKRAGRE